MGPVGHSLAGLSLYFGYCLSTRKNPSLKGMAGSILLANSPDFDLTPAIWAGLPKANMYHHSVMHTLTFALVIGLVPAIVYWIADGWFNKKLAVLGFLLVSSHVIADFLTMDTSFPFGVMIFWPITDTYYLGPTVFLPIYKATWMEVISVNNLKASIHEILIFTPIISLITFHLVSKTTLLSREISK